MKQLSKIFFVAFLLCINFVLLASDLLSQLVSDFRVNDDNTDASHLAAKVDSDSSGNFVIVWQDGRFSSVPQSSRTIVGQRYFNSGQALGGNFYINGMKDTGATPDIVVKKNGDFVVCWSAVGMYKIVAKMFDKNAVPISDLIQVSDSNYSNSNPSIGADSFGNFIITWEYYYPGLGERVFYQRFDFNGNKLGGNRNVSDTLISSRKSEPDLSIMSEDGFIICWQDNRLNIASYDIFMQMFDANGNKIGSNVKVNQDTTAFQGYPKTTCDSSGKFCISWFDLRAFPNYLTYCQFYNTNGSVNGDNLFVSFNIPTCISSRSNGDLAIGMNEGSNLRAQRIKSDRTLLGNSFLITDQALSTDKTLTDIKVFNDRLISVWQDRRNNHFDIYCNVRSYSHPDSSTGIIQISNEVPSNFSLSQNFPNPFNPSTTIPFQIAKTDFVTLQIYDIRGKHIKSLINEKLTAGKYEYKFNANELPGGSYFYVLKYNKFFFSKTMILVK